MRGEEPITRIKGIGPKTAEAFGRLGVFTVEDLIRFLPRSFFRLPEPVTGRLSLEDVYLYYDVRVKRSERACLHARF